MFAGRFSRRRAADARTAVQRPSPAARIGRRGIAHGLIGVAVSVAVLALPTDCGFAQAQPKWQKRWVRIALNLLVDRNVEQTRQIIRRAAAAGYNGVVLADFKLQTWWDPNIGVPERWRQNARAVRELARSLGMECWVSIWSVGYASGILAHDPNLVSGVPIRDAPLVARGGVLVPADKATLVNGGFEDHTGPRAAGWFHDQPGQGSFVDTTVAHSGRASMCLNAAAHSNKAGNCRVAQTIQVRPWQQYRLSYWVHLENASGYYQTLVLEARSDRHLQICGYRTRGEEGAPIIKTLHGKTADWVRQAVTFNSLDNTKVRIYIGVWGKESGGKLWVDDVQIEPVPTLNVIRRDSLPLKLVGEDGTTYEEGRDFERVVDPKLGRARWSGTFGVYHDPPQIRLTQNSRIRDGQRVRLSCYHALLMPHDQVNCTLADPKVFEILRQMVRANERLLSPDGWFLGYDEMRVAGWEPLEQKFKTTGEALAFNVRRSCEIVRAEGGGKPMCTWSDMFDPGHNAHENYYMVANTLAGSWEGLPKDMMIVTWVPWRKSTEFFARRGHRQIVAGYYDGDVKRNHDNWAKAVAGLPGIIGTMYTTWSQNWSDLEAYARIWWGK